MSNDNVFVFQLMNDYYMLGANAENNSYLNAENLSITIKPINCSNITNESLECETFSQIEIRNSDTILMVSKFLKLQNLIFTGYDLVLSTD